jgi:hypothetical protein
LILWRWIGNLAALLTLTGISLSHLLEDQFKSWLALIVFTAVGGYIAWLAYRTTEKLLQLHCQIGIMPISTFARWATADGRNIVYEVFRNIQVKRPFIKQIDHQFAWTGTKPPTVKSDLQAIKLVSTEAGASSLRFILPYVRVFNETEVLHCRMDLDDSDQCADPFLEQIVRNPIRFISFRVELLHVTPRYHREQAVLIKTKLDENGPLISETVAKIKFDGITKSFEYNLTDPTPGYRYRLKWTRPTYRDLARSK